MTEVSLTTLLPASMRELRTGPLLTVRLDVEGPMAVGATPAGDRRVGVITGGRFEGERGLRGRALPGGSDWQILRADGVLTLDVRMVLETEDKHLIGMTYRGLRHGPAQVLARLARGEAVDPSEYYFRAAPLFETASDRYGWLNRVVAVSTGHRFPDGPIYQVFEVL